MSFKRSAAILNELPGLYGAIITNFESKQLLEEPIGNSLPMKDIVESASDTIRYQRNSILDMDFCDVVEHMITVTPHYNLIHYLVPHFDNVLIFAIVRRNTPLPIILRTLEQAGDAMRGW
ncbi:hypothetical protein [Kingella negevensis]|uniref:Roadblock/LAMTOR2 domain-containing protein n=1 Tax=Kingella negevensis TaxID=1522312 RepID=A0A238TA83_9NEIS|nr:hypothetical protein [Kingella negevensis]MDK4680128.1 hypothetical protein [Kingella negevensis]MDK4682152.1 hypothetical protein [Kingella negevensis]MDK4685027.1 hypothetical protein [Kingella negevensis]MDK4689657.1 hypothetical protein [Kingella negevensis]MDK4690349.1 hypothetical protein [Kingella negevensis]